MIWQKDIECASRSEIEDIQLKKLKALVAYCDKNIPFYNKKFADMGITSDKIKVLSDIEHLPITTKEDIRDSYPFGFFARPMKDIVRIHASSGTTGKPTVVGYTKNDLDMWSDCMARLICATGATDEDICQISFGYGLFTGALGLHYGLEKIGATVIPMSSGNTEKQLMLMKDFGVTLLVSTPSYAVYMSEFALENGYKKEDFKLRLGLFGSEGCTPEMRSRIESNLGLFATDNYGMSELMGPGVSGECTERNGLHIAEDHFLCEIVDSDSLSPVNEGDTGELIVTTLSKEGFPVIRYRTKDISRITKENCACGRTSARMDKIKGRSDDMLIIKGVNVFPSQIESVLVGTEEHIGPHYQLMVRRQGFMDTLEVKVELINGDLLERYSELEALQKSIQAKLKSVLGLEAKVSLVEPKSIERFQGKAKRVVDLR